jgi:flavodoxin
MKPLVVYFSLNGNTRFIAENIAAETGADMLEIRTIVPYKPGSRFMGVKSFIQVLTRFKPRLRFFDRNPYSYDLIFIGSPVWAGTYSPPINSFFNKIDLKDKKVAVFCCHRGRSGRMLHDMKERLACSDIVGEKNFYEPLNFEKVRNAHIARSWAREMVNKDLKVSSIIDDARCIRKELPLEECVHF